MTKISIERSQIVVPILVCLAALCTTACETMTASEYTNSADNSVELRKYSGTKADVVTINDRSNFDEACRLEGSVEGPGGLTVAQFIQGAFNDEFKLAGIYSSDPAATKITAELETAQFSSSSGILNGSWELRVRLANAATTESLVAESRYDFKSGFGADTACKQTAEALTPAVQRLINSAITDPRFATLVAPAASYTVPASPHASATPRQSDPGMQRFDHWQAQTDKTSTADPRN